MGWIEALKQSLDLFGAQVKPASSRNSSSPPSQKVDPRELGFTNNALKKMAEWYLSEADVKDVFYHGGVVVKQNMMVKKYNGYEFGLYYFQDKQTGRLSSLLHGNEEDIDYNQVSSDILFLL